MMHESKGQHIGKAPSLHLFHTTFRQCMAVFLKRTTSCLGMRLKPCHVFLQHYHKSVLTAALLLHASVTTYTLNLSGLQIGHSNQCVKLKYSRTGLITTWMGADSALKNAV